MWMDWTCLSLSLLMRHHRHWATMDATIHARTHACTHPPIYMTVVLVRRTLLVDSTLAFERKPIRGAYHYLILWILNHLSIAHETVHCAAAAAAAAQETTCSPVECRWYQMSKEKNKSLRFDNNKYPRLQLQLLLTLAESNPSLHTEHARNISSRRE